MSIPVGHIARYCRALLCDAKIARMSETGGLGRVVAKPDWLLGTACVCAILATGGYAIRSVREAVATAAAAGAARGSEAPGGVGPTEVASSTVDAAHFTFTNIYHFSVGTCRLGVVQRISTGKTIRSATICTGAMAPRSTVAIYAPYPVGAVKAMCNGQADRYGNQFVDWDLCTFTTEAVP